MSLVLLSASNVVFVFAFISPRYCFCFKFCHFFIFIFFVFRAAQPWLCLPGHGGERLSVCLVFLQLTHLQHVFCLSSTLLDKTNAVIFMHFYFTFTVHRYIEPLYPPIMILIWSHVTCGWSRGTTCWSGSRRTSGTATRATWAAWRERRRAMGTAATRSQTRLCCLTEPRGIQSVLNC